MGDAPDPAPAARRLINGLTDEQYIRREMARKTKLIADDFERLADDVASIAEVMLDEGRPAVATVADLARAVTHGSGVAGMALSAVVNELGQLYVAQADTTSGTV